MLSRHQSLIKMNKKSWKKSLVQMHQSKGQQALTIAWVSHNSRHSSSTWTRLLTPIRTSWTGTMVVRRKSEKLQKSTPPRCPQKLRKEPKAAPYTLRKAVWAAVTLTVRALENSIWLNHPQSSSSNSSPSIGPAKTEETDKSTVYSHLLRCKLTQVKKIHLSWQVAAHQGAPTTTWIINSNR